MASFYDYLGKNIRVTFVDDDVLEGFCNTFTGKLDTEDEMYDELTIKTDKNDYVGFNESEVKTIELIQHVTAVVRCYFYTLNN